MGYGSDHDTENEVKEDKAGANEEKMDISDSEFEDAQMEAPVSAVAAAPAAAPTARIPIVTPTTSLNKPTEVSIKPKMEKGSSSTGSTTRVLPVEHYRWIPLRLSEHERSLLNVLVSALEVCEYTDVVDVTFSHTRKSKTSRIMESLVDILSIASGLMLATDLVKGEQLVSGKTLNDNVPFFAELFEIGRRYKIMNPSRLRSTYGKLMYLLMDAESYQIKSELQINFVKPILTVTSFINSKGLIASDILSDPLWTAATVSVDDEYNTLPRHEVQAKHDSKAAAFNALIEKYSESFGGADDVRRVIDSIADDNANLVFNARPVERALHLLKTRFSADKPTDGLFSLALSGGGGSSSSNMGKNSNKGFFTSGFLLGNNFGNMGGDRGGAKLSHNHPTQYRFVLQSLTLWREIMRCMPRLWFYADMDMTKESYRLVDTGQGYQRLQSCPNVRGEMSRILGRVQSEVGSWVGLSVVHLADRDVPNALVFIDKYTQVPRILSPIVQCVESLPALVEDAAFHAYVEKEWGTIDRLRMSILADFYKHGFDGSGDDGGSCIDGRLTSAWNWCSRLQKKNFYHVFMFTGFQGFDGDWKGN